MLKNIITKINNFIQWTKKWHFFHVFIIPSYIVLFITLTMIFIFICEYIYTGKFEYNFMLQYIGVLHSVVFKLFSIYMPELWLALVVQILFSGINWYLYRNISVKSNFLLNNKRYNCIYVIIWIYAIICFILYKTCMHLILNYVF